MNIEKEISKDELTTQAMVLFQRSPFAFIEKSLGETPQPIKSDFKQYVLHLYNVPAREFSEYASTIHKDMFEPFVKGKHLTWQQCIFVIAVQRAVNGTLPRKIAVKAGRGTGKQISLDEVVYKVEKNTIKTVTAKEIKIGDTILGLHKPTKVLDVIPQPVQQLYRVTLDDGESCVVGLEHNWTVSDGQIRKKIMKRVGYKKGDETEMWETIDTQEMLSRGLHMWNKNPEKRFRLPIQSIEGFKKVSGAYVVGVWYGDGHRGVSRYTKPDEFIASKIKSLGYELSEISDSGSRTIYGFKKYLEKIGGSLQKEGLPIDFLDWDYNSRVELLRGLMDTDGSCDKKGFSEFTTVIPKLAKDVQLLIRSLGGKTNIRIKEKTFYNDKEDKRVYCKPAYRLGVTTIFNPFSLPRKAKRWHKPTQDRYLYRFVNSIEPDVVNGSVCYTVEAEDSLYLIGEGLIATHNSAIMSRLILWFLFSFPLSKIPCTAPTADQLFAVLWSELNLVLSQMKPEYKSMFDWETKFIRIKQRSQVWYARAKTASPGETGALSGVHSDFMASFADESYDVADEVFQVAEATQTGDISLMVLAGNAVHDHGYFYECFNKHSDEWVQITMNGEESPIVNQETIQAQERQYGKNSNHYRASVLGEFPIATAIDVDGYARMYSDEWIEDVMPTQPKEGDEDLFDHKRLNYSRSFLGVDPAGEGTDEAVGYLRNATVAIPAFSLQQSSTRSIALTTINTIETYGLDGSDVTVDNFGVGAELAQEVAIQSNGQYNINGINTGNRPEEILDQAAYMNERARTYHALYWWGKRGGRIKYDEQLREELKTIYSRKNEQGRLQIMPKREMRKRGYKSPNRADSCTLTFQNDRMMANYIPRGEFRAIHVPVQQNKVPEAFDVNNSIPSF